MNILNLYFQGLLSKHLFWFLSAISNLWLYLPVTSLHMFLVAAMEFKPIKSLWGLSFFNYWYFLLCELLHSFLFLQLKKH